MVYPADGLSSVSDVLVFVGECLSGVQVSVYRLCSLCEANKQGIEAKAAFAHSLVFLLGTRSKRMHWMDARALRRKDAFAKGHGEIPSVIHGSPIGKPYPSSAASLRSLDFENLAN
ncbi:hypothetical protein VNO80_16365 [Phaseolus coccineus]|uniref:Uncharacterized protein n=1 Tax=Phaseolus coccineus TaxID=3886 RepID=A0AAN9KRP9_PHACN